MARQIRDVLLALGHEVTLVSELRSFVKSGRSDEQLEKQDEAVPEIDRLRRHWRSDSSSCPDVWMTYHNYHKAPDWLGPALAAEFALPYLIIEPSIAPVKAEGSWSLGYSQALRGFELAKKLLVMTAKDHAGFAAFPDLAAKCCHFPPFVAEREAVTGGLHDCRYRIAEHHGLDPRCPWIVTTAMMRDDVKLQSYLAAIEILADLCDVPWQWLVIGDGEARDTIEPKAKAALGQRVVFAGQLPTSDVRHYLSASDIYFWPAFDEAYGMAILEAQSAGLPAVAFDEGGVNSIVQHERTGFLVPERDHALAGTALRRLMGDADLRQNLGEEAARLVQRDLSFAAAAKRLGEALA